MAGRESTRLLQMFDMSPTSISIADTTLEGSPLIYANPSFSKLTGYGVEDFIGENCNFLQGKKTDEYSIALIAKSIAEKSNLSICIKNYKKNGEPFDNLLILYHFKSALGEDRCIGCQYDLRVDRYNNLVREHLESVHGIIDQSTILGGTPIRMAVESMFMQATSVQLLIETYFRTQL